MAKIKFTDGVEFDVTADAPRITRKSDGLYVVGRNMLIPVDSYEEGLAIVKDMEQNSPRKV